jgi:hypothetical protein
MLLVGLHKSIYVVLLTRLYTCRLSYYIYGVEKGIMLVVPPYLKILDQPSYLQPGTKKDDARASSGGKNCAPYVFFKRIQ